MVMMSTRSSEEDAPLHRQHRSGPRLLYRGAGVDRTYDWPDFLGVDTDSGASLEKLSIPGLWIFGDKDPSIPVDLSIDRLKKLSSSGHPYEYVLFPGLGHNNMDETFSVATDWIRRSTTKKSE